MQLNHSCTKCGFSMAVARVVCMSCSWLKPPISFMLKSPNTEGRREHTLSSNLMFKFFNHAQISLNSFLNNIKSLAITNITAYIKAKLNKSESRMSENLQIRFYKYFNLVLFKLKNKWSLNRNYVYNIHCISVAKLLKYRIWM